MKKNFTQERKSYRFVNQILQFIKEFDADTISVQSVHDGGVRHDCIIQNPQHEILHEENILCLFDEQRENSVQIPIDEVTGVSNTIFADSAVCSVCFRRSGLFGVILTATC